MNADRCLESFALEVVDDFAATGIVSDGIGVLVDVGEGFTGEMGFTWPDQGVPWGLTSVESFDAAKELWRAMGKSWDCVFLVANLRTQVVDCFFFTARDTYSWRKGRNDYLGAKEKFLELYRAVA